MKHLRLALLALVLALTFTVTGGGFTPDAEAQTCSGFRCTSDSYCVWYCCSREYPCNPNEPPFCSYLNETDPCGFCFC